jgi:hypothetical protein
MRLVCSSFVGVMIQGDCSFNRKGVTTDLQLPAINRWLYLLLQICTYKVNSVQIYCIHKFWLNLLATISWCLSKYYVTADYRVPDIMSGTASLNSIACIFHVLKVVWRSSVDAYQRHTTTKLGWTLLLRLQIKQILAMNYTTNLNAIIRPI